MLDIDFIRKNPEKVEEGARLKGFEVRVKELLEIDKERRKILKEVEQIRAEKNRTSKEISKISDKREKERIISSMRTLDKKEEKLKKELEILERKFKELMEEIPNLPFENVPPGKDDKDNVVVREVGEKRKFDFPPKSYLEIAEKYDLIDIKRAAKISGSRFGILKREAVLMHFAILNFTFEKLLKEGFIPILPPVMLKEEMAKGTGYFESTDLEEAYYLPKDNLFLIGTSEQSLIAMHANEVFEEKELPKRYLGFSTCFRREAGSYGKDTQGIFRVHQFDKIEMISFCKPEDSRKEHQFFLSLQESLMQQLGLPFRIVQICTGDLGRPAAEKFDIEVWFPSQERYRETHSTSNCTDFQARRLNIRYNEKGKIRFVHTINGTAFALGRILIAIFENYQTKEGKIKVPQALKKFLTFDEIGK
jgi:seryl-tRNA synthetase